MTGQARGGEGIKLLWPKENSVYSTGGISFTGGSVHYHTGEINVVKVYQSLYIS